MSLPHKFHAGINRLLAAFPKGFLVGKFFVYYDDVLTKSSIDLRVKVDQNLGLFESTVYGQNITNF